MLARAAKDTAPLRAIGSMMAVLVDTTRATSARRATV
jgi:hypothetical protein